MTLLAWMFGAGFLVACALLAFMSSMAIRFASEVNDLLRKLRVSRQAHALDVQALTAKMQELQRQVPR